MKSLFFIVLLCSTQSYAQVQEQSSFYKSKIDEILTIKKIAILPATDNVGGIYARPIELTIKKIINENHHWDIVNDDYIGPILTPTELEVNPEKAKSLVKNINADAAISAQAIKGPEGISIKLHLYLIKDGRLLSRSELNSSTHFEIKKIKLETKKLTEKVLQKIPYDGLVLSRIGKKVTLNVGYNDGIKPDQIVSVVQIIKANYHPKFKFLISTEKEILGKIKILKVDKTLSFGQIITEIDRLAIEKNAKIIGLTQIEYDNVSDIKGTSSINQLLSRTDSKISFGKKPKQWLPKKPPTFGSVSAGLGLGSFDSDIRREGSSYKTSDSMGKNLSFNGDLWLTAKVNLHAEIKQGIVDSNSSANYNFLGGYVFRLGNSVWDSYVELLAGYSSYSVDVNDFASKKTNLTYSGLKLGVQGQVPITSDKKWAIGAKLFLYPSPSVSYSPKVENLSDVTANQFSIFGHKKIGEKLKVTTSIDTELYTSKFNGSTESSSQKSTTLTTSMTYLF